MQEEVLKLVLLALEDGSALSRKVLVMFVVQRLEPHFPQASKTSIGHVVQLLYRASCFKVNDLFNNCKFTGTSNFFKKERIIIIIIIERFADCKFLPYCGEEGQSNVIVCNRIPLKFFV